MADAEPGTHDKKWTEPVAPSEVESVRRTALGGIEVRVRGRAEPLAEAKVSRGFPWSMPDRYIGLMTKEGKEIALLFSLDDLDPVSREAVREEIRDRVFNPRIRRVTDYRNEFGVTSITAETDRGPVTFQIRSRDDIRILSAVRALFRDADGNTYELEDLRGLDPESRKHLDPYF